MSQPDLKSARSDMELASAAQILCANNIGALPVIGDQGDVIGIVSERDIVRSIVNCRTEFFSKRVDEVMTRSVITCGPDDLTEDVYEVLSVKQIRHIPVVEEGRMYGMLSIRDFENAHRRLRAQALTDSLTGLHNLRHFLGILDNEFNRYRRFQSPLAVATIEVFPSDEFNSHAASDGLLRKLAGLITEQTRAYDSVGRTGDHRFGLILPNTDARTANRACERLLWALRTSASRVAGDAPDYRVSIGLAFGNRRNCDGRSILERADKLAETAGANGGDCIEADELAQPTEDSASAA
ncbi:CBS domain-containing protein [Oricola cellulosilytica]|nr:CBS domain-containing protein [Oricola cellulosilytica]